MNWISSLRFDKTTIGNFSSDIQVHKSFYEVYKSKEKEISKHSFNLLKDSKYKELKVVFASDSLEGAAIKLRAGTDVPDLKKMGNKVDRFVYRSFRVGNNKRVQHLTGLAMKIARYTNKKDLIRHVPSRALAYIHVPSEFYFDSKAKNTSIIKCAQTHDEDPKCGYREHFPPSVDDHTFAFNTKKGEFYM